MKNADFILSGVVPGDLVYWDQHINARNFSKQGECYTYDKSIFFGIVAKVRKDILIVFAPFFHGRIKLKAAEVLAFDKSKDG